MWDKASEASVSWLSERSTASQPPESDPERSAREAARRAATKCRRYCVSHGLTRLVTVTFAQEPDIDGGWQAIERFRRNLATYNGGHPLPMLVVPEWGTKGDRLHFHCLLGKFIPQPTLVALWGQGLVDVRLIRARTSDGPRGRRADARTAASYVASYVGKSFGDEKGHRAEWRRRYSTTKGTAIEPRRQRFATLDEAISFVLGEKGSASLDWVWSSETVEDWHGPPVRLLQWGDPPGA